MNDDNDNGVCVSAPGKVLITGGYLVLDPGHSGLVLASTARFYAHVTAAPSSSDAKQGSSVHAASNSSNDASDNTDTLHVVVESPQFSQIICGSLHRDALSGAYQFVTNDGSDRNAYIEETLLCAVNGIEGIAPGSIAHKARKLNDANQHVRARLRADNDFYSQVQREVAMHSHTHYVGQLDCQLQAAQQPLERCSLAALDRFLPPFMETTVSGDRVAMKTGMGSSAALVTALVGALVCFFVPTNCFEAVESDRDVIHNLAQLSHCFVQRKIGSGFDVSAACFGSQRYTRFPPALLDAFTSPDALTPTALGRCLLDNASWDNAHRVTPFALPPGLRMLMGDVSAGSATVSMVRQVLGWQAAEPESAHRVVTSLAYANAAVAVGFDALHALLTPRSTSTSSSESDAASVAAVRIAMAQLTSDEWTAVDARLGAALVQLRESFMQVRQQLREMGECAGAPIEPPEQTALVDATMAIPGVIIAGVPGAGGFDAVFVVVLDESVLDRVEQLWTAWPLTHPTATICPLLGDVDTSRGIRRERSASSDL